MQHQALHICTYASPRRRSLGQLERSCETMGAHLTVLGLEKPYRGFCEKFLAVQRFIQPLPEGDVVLFLDGYDTLLLAPPQEILKTFLEMHAPIVVAAERDSYPDGALATLYPQSPTSFRYVNSGLYIGFVGALKSFFQAIEPFHAEDDDQAIMAHYFLDHPDKMVLDTGCRLFLNTAKLTTDELVVNVDTRRVEALETHSRPCAIHGNGKSLWYQYISDLLFPEKHAIELESYKTVTLALVGAAWPLFLQKQLQMIEQLDYPKDKIILLIDAFPATQSLLRKWKKSVESYYKGIYFKEHAVDYAMNPDLIAHICSTHTPPENFEEALQFAEHQKTEYCFLVDWNVFLTPCTLKALMQAKKAVVAPLLRLFLATSDFSMNFYSEPAEFMKITREEIQGTFAVPFVSGSFLVDMQQKREEASFFVSNEHNYGTMIQLPEYPSAEPRLEQIELLHAFFKKSSF